MGRFLFLALSFCLLTSSGQATSKCPTVLRGPKGATLQTWQEAGKAIREFLPALEGDVSRPIAREWVGKVTVTKTLEKINADGSATELVHWEKSNPDGQLSIIRYSQFEDGKSIEGFDVFVSRAFGRYRLEFNEMNKLNSNRSPHEPAIHGLIDTIKKQSPVLTAGQNHLIKTLEATLRDDIVVKVEGNRLFLRQTTPGKEDMVLFIFERSSRSKKLVRVSGGVIESTQSQGAPARETTEFVLRLR